MYASANYFCLRNYDLDFTPLHQNMGPLADDIAVASLMFFQATWKCITFEDDKWLQQSFAHAAG